MLAPACFSSPATEHANARRAVPVSTGGFLTPRCSLPMFLRLFPEASLSWFQADTSMHAAAQPLAHLPPAQPGLRMVVVQQIPCSFRTHRSLIIVLARDAASSSI